MAWTFEMEVDHKGDGERPLSPRIDRIEAEQDGFQAIGNALFDELDRR